MVPVVEPKRDNITILHLMEEGFDISEAISKTQYILMKSPEKLLAFPEHHPKIEGNTYILQ